MFSLVEDLFGVQYLSGLEFGELVDQLLQRALAMDLVIPGSDVNAIVSHFFVADNQYEVVLSQLCVSHLLVDGKSGVQFRVHLKAGLIQLLPDLLGVLVNTGSDGQHYRLARRQPEWPINKNQSV